MPSATFLHRSNKKYRNNPTFSIVPALILGNQTKEKTDFMSIELGRRKPNLKTQRKLGKNVNPHLLFAGKFWPISEFLIS